jgi:hypothetical protein
MAFEQTAWSNNKRVPHLLVLSIAGENIVIHLLFTWRTYVISRIPMYEHVSEIALRQFRVQLDSLNFGLL